MKNCLSISVTNFLHQKVRSCNNVQNVIHTRIYLYLMAITKMKLDVLTCRIQYWYLMLKILWKYLALLHKKVDPCENSGFLHVTHEVLYITKLQYHTRTTLCKPLWQGFWNFFESRTINDRFLPVDHKIKWRTFFESVLFSKKLYLANIWTNFF